MRSVVEGYRPPALREWPVPLHHPAGGPSPSELGEDRYPFNASAIVCAIGVVGRPASRLRSPLSS
jgi:hypothetical protein